VLFKSFIFINNFDFKVGESPIDNESDSVEILCSNTLDLSTFARSLGFVPGIGVTGLPKQRWGMKDLAAKFLKVNLSKDERLAQWSHPNLSPKSLLYAAVDVHIGRLIYEAILTIPKILKKRPVKPFRNYSERCLVAFAEINMFPKNF